MWTYATLCVLSKMYRKLLFNNLSIVWNIKILLTGFCQESPQVLCAKFRGNCVTSRDSAQFSVHVVEIKDDKFGEFWGSFGVCSGSEK